MKSWGLVVLLSSDSAVLVFQNIRTTGGPPCIVFQKQLLDLSTLFLSLFSKSKISEISVKNWNHYLAKFISLKILT